MAGSTYVLELVLKRAPTENPQQEGIDLRLSDRERPGVSADGTAFLNLDENVPGTEVAVRTLRDDFLDGRGGVANDGINLGKFLFDKLFGGDLASLWQSASERRCGPLRLEIVMSEPELAELSGLPFELLADEDGFLFRREGFSIVRVVTGLPTRELELGAQDAILVAWAQPREVEYVDPGYFKNHEDAVQDGGERAGLTVRSPIPNVSLATLEEQLAGPKGARIVSLVCHGDVLKPIVFLHDSDHSKWPEDPGTPVDAADLARVLKKGDVAVAFLWSCHGARHSAPLGSVSTTLLHPEHGNLAAVVASQGAMRADASSLFMRKTLVALCADGPRDLERAVSAGRLALPASDLHWAAPVYYARPRGGRSVTLAAQNVTFPAATSPARSMDRMPAAWLYFRGRESEISTGLTAMLSCRLVTVLGMAGMGKTELASEIARRAMLDSSLAFVRGLWLPLDGIRTADAMIEAIASWLGLSADSPISKIGQQLGKERILILLDNAEDPLQADSVAVRKLLDELLRACSGLCLLVTSRQCLGDLRTSSESLLHVRPLDPLAAREAFVAAAGGRLTSIELASSELGEILHWADGHPMTLVLLAKQLGTFTAKTLLKRITKSGAASVFDTSLIGEAETPADQIRYQRLVGSLNLSLDPVATSCPAAAEMFAWLGLFPAGLAAQHIEDIFGAEAEDLRAILVRRNLVLVIGPEHRLFLPAPVRAYARKQLESMQPERRWRLLGNTLMAIGKQLNILYQSAGTTNAGASFKAAQEESPNIDALIDSCDPNAPITTAVASAITRVLALILVPHIKLGELGGRPKAVERIARAGLSLAVRLDPNTLGTARIHQAFGELLCRIDLLDEAEIHYRAALQIYAQAEYPDGLAAGFRLLGALYCRTYRNVEAEQAFRLSLRYESNPRSEANTQLVLGVLLQRTERPEQSAAAYNAALRLYREGGNLFGQGRAHYELGQHFAHRGEPVAAKASYDEALKLYALVDSRLGQASTLVAMANLLLRNSQGRDAEIACRKALVLYSQDNARLEEANAFLQLGEILETQPDAAEAAFDTALVLYREVGALQGQADVMLALGNLKLRATSVRASQADLAQIGDSLLQARDTYRSIRHALGEANAEDKLARFYRLIKQDALALSSYHTALAIDQRIGNRLGEAQVLNGLGELHAAAGRLADAESAYSRAITICSGINYRSGVAQSTFALGIILIHSNRASEAAPHFIAALAFNVEIKDQSAQAACQYELGRCYLLTNRFTQAEESLLLSIDLARKTGNLQGQANALAEYGRLAIEQGLGAVGFERILQSYAIQRTFDNPSALGITHCYLARAACRARRWNHSICLAALALELFDRSEGKAQTELAWRELAYTFGACRHDLVATTGIVAFARADIEAQLLQYPPQTGLDSVAHVLRAIEDARVEYAATGQNLYAPFSSEETI